MLGALINEYNSGTYIVMNVVNVQSEKSLKDIKDNFNYSYVLVVDETVKNGMEYVPTTGIIKDYTGKRIYPPQTTDDKINSIVDTINTMNYNANVNNFEDLESLKTYLIGKNKKNLENYLLAHPLVINDKTYTVTSDKQNQLTGLLQAYTFGKSIGTEIPLTWNETGKECESYTFEQLVQLYLSILDYVKPIVTYQQHIEIEIREATTKEEALSADIYFLNYKLNTTEETSEKSVEE